MQSRTGQGSKAKPWCCDFTSASLGQDGKLKIAFSRYPVRKTHDGFFSLPRTKNSKLPFLATQDGKLKIAFLATHHGLLAAVAALLNPCDYYGPNPSWCFRSLSSTARQVLWRPIWEFPPMPRLRKGRLLKLTLASSSLSGRARCLNYRPLAR